MMAWLTGLLSGAWTKLLAVGAGAAAIGGAFLVVRKEGQQSQRISDLKQKDIDHGKVDQTRSNVDGASSADVNKRLQEFQRK